MKIFTGHSSEVWSVVFSPDGKTIASGGDNTVKLWDVATGKQITTFTGHSSEVWSVVFSPDGKTIASGSDDNTVKLWNFYPNDLNGLMILGCDLVRGYWGEISEAVICRHLMAERLILIGFQKKLASGSIKL